MDHPQLTKRQNLERSVAKVLEKKMTIMTIVRDLTPRTKKIL